MNNLFHSWHGIAVLIWNVATKILLFFSCRRKLQVCQEKCCIRCNNGI